MSFLISLRTWGGMLTSFWSDGCKFRSKQSFLHTAVADESWRGGNIRRRWLQVAEQIQVRCAGGGASYSVFGEASCAFQAMISQGLGPDSVERGLGSVDQVLGSFMVGAVLVGSGWVGGEWRSVPCR